MAIQRTGRRPWERVGLRGQVTRKGLFSRFWEAGPSLALRGGPSETYHRLLHINLLPPRKAEVRNLGGQVLSD